MTRLSASLLFLLSVFASTAHAQITTVQGSPRGYPLPVTVSGTISTPGGATSAKQDAQTALLTAGNASTASIDATLTVVNTKFGAIGQQLAAASAPVVLPAAQVALLAQAAQLPAALVGGRFDVNLGTSSITLPVSMASAPTGAALDATLAKLTIAQGTALGANTLALGGCSVTTAAPTYTTGQIQPCSLDTLGRLRVAPTDALTPADGTANPTTLIGTEAFLMGWNPNTSRWDRVFVEGVAADANNGPTAGVLSVEGYNMVFNGSSWDRIRSSGAGTGSMRILPHDGVNGVAITAPSTAAVVGAPALVTAASPNSPTPKHADTTCSGTLTNGSPTLLCASLQGVSTAGFHLAYGASGSISAACSYDGTNFSGAIPLSANSTPETPVTSVSASGDWFFQTPACTSVRFTLTAGTGSHTVTARFSGATPAPAPKSFESVVGAAANGAAVSGNPVLVAGSDGTNARTLSTDGTGRLKAAGSSWAYYAANATTTFVSGAAILRRVTITAASSAGNSCVLYDSTGAATNPIAGFDAQIRGVFEFNAAVSNGITLICAGGTAPQLTAMWN